jgi:hypothetical protein
MLIPTRQSYKPPKAAINSQNTVFCERTDVSCVFQNALKSLVGKPEVKRPLGIPRGRVDRRIILKKWCVRVWTVIIGSG